MIRLEGRPGDERGFLHKKLLGLVGKIVDPVTSFLPVVSQVKSGIGIAKGILGGRQRAVGRPAPPEAFTSRPTAAGAAGKEIGRQLKLGNGNGRALTKGNGEPDCTFPLRWDRKTGSCRLFLGEQSGPNGNGGGFPIGDAVMGRYGAALQPGIMEIERSVCLRGMQLGNDGLCYNKGQISNTQRMWPRGRRPLLTGGDMRAIGIASRAGAKLDRTTTRLRALGMMKALPKPRKAAHHHHPAQIGS